MAETEDEEEQAPPKGGSKTMIIGVLLAAIFGGGSFYATYSGLLLADDPEASEKKEVIANDAEGGMSYVEMEPILVSLGTGNQRSFLKFRAQLEVRDPYVDEVRESLPKIVDILVSYLRAVRPEDIEDPAALPVIRSHMFHRISLITGLDRVNDLLIMEYIIN